MLKNGTAVITIKDLITSFNGVVAKGTQCEIASASWSGDSYSYILVLRGSTTLKRSILGCELGYAFELVNPLDVMSERLGEKCQRLTLSL